MKQLLTRRRDTPFPWLLPRTALVKALGCSGVLVNANPQLSKGGTVAPANFHGVNTPNVANFKPT